MKELIDNPSTLLFYCFFVGVLIFVGISMALLIKKGREGSLVYAYLIFIAAMSFTCMFSSTMKERVLPDTNPDSLAEGASAFNAMHRTDDVEHTSISLVQVDSIWMEKYAYAWDTSLSELNDSETARAFMDNYKELCSYQSVDCFISLEEEKGHYLEMRQLDDAYAVKKDAHKEKKSGYKPLKTSSNVENIALLKELHDSGFTVEDYGFYLLKKDRTNKVTLILEPSLDDTTYQQLMSILKKHIADYEFDLHFKKPGNKYSSEILEYKDLVKEVKEF